MFFNSPLYIFLFFPLVSTGYILLARFFPIVSGKVWLTAASLIFYGYFNIKFLVLLIISVFFNYLFGLLIIAVNKKMPSGHYHKIILGLGIFTNLCFLAYYKYANFFINTFSDLTGVKLSILTVIFPIGISYYTIQQISYLVDCFREKKAETNIINYVLYVTFYPQLTVGPIVRYKEFIPQIKNAGNRQVNWSNVSLGWFIFCLGLFKKNIIADALAVWANIAFDQVKSLTFIESWAASLCYTFQLYYDFSGYTDMAIGSALIINILLPLNFNSPYQAKNIQEFWRRWHISLSRWLRDYIYIPMGGNKKGLIRTLVNLSVTFWLAGLWHGAGWTFIVWGGLHGLALVAHRLWQRTGIKLPAILGWLTTFMFINMSWVFFRSASISDALVILKSMTGLNGFQAAEFLRSFWQGLANMPIIAFIVPNDQPLIIVKSIVYILLSGMLALLLPNSCQLIKLVPAAGKFEFSFSWKYALLTSIIFFLSLLTFLGDTAPTEFLYLKF